MFADMYMFADSHNLHSIKVIGVHKAVTIRDVNYALKNYEMKEGFILLYK